ncbi:MAG: NAD(P)-dependent oxidoreductase [Bdellovibrionales bacterium RIFOXYD12_FULL_39_22]|nr:MAG: NAD(P)-dependent oxidoreductase [Bdellovibrionales bacterium RIFOXYB1_FULL_39_21]OFZ42758.1 MAG: NAD(P)-dependent oxidoreductase [Bdellovibrionales bacterium RIFOXYC12_FULL_39_17]OFZ47317.1 MAG: NAD(P)-dependent oxidoreductase [Bdellovibrionales bacterium RIFOXYC1_FULL_39_130]OFZ70894.1 MAG: NAD(P)-dependent oxidoreductase [Bdellovibrionales bacterium RIFOXYC2_FULL_39_8]OFZ75483.1 MAG: NAD(P)-dependent oxidoreductase [Bdellovibrionales bacterium RIFOXYD1_FULL_39_84]OFZ93437.1 MAG: NAD(
MYCKTVFITGATSGIGRACANLFAKELRYNLILCGRREERLQELQNELSEFAKIHTLKFDVRNRSEVENAIQSLPAEFTQIDILINNAGNAHGLDPIDSALMDDIEAMVDINLKGLLYVSKAIIPSMIARKAGHIINVGSLAGKEVYPNGAVYCASKFAVDALNRGMRMDLNSYGIKVSIINPGMVETEFSLVRFKGDYEKAKSVYRGLTPLAADDIAQTILFVATRPPHVNLADIIVLPNAQASASIVKREA